MVVGVAVAVVVVGVVVALGGLPDAPQRTLCVARECLAPTWATCAPRTHTQMHAWGAAEVLVVVYIYIYVCMYRYMDMGIVDAGQVMSSLRVQGGGVCACVCGCDTPESRILDTS